jgi:hypothetical protein
MAHLQNKLRLLYIMRRKKATGFGGKMCRPAAFGKAFQKPENFSFQF